MLVDVLHPVVDDAWVYELGEQVGEVKDGYAAECCEEVEAAVLPLGEVQLQHQSETEEVDDHDAG